MRRASKNHIPWAKRYSCIEVIQKLVHQENHVSGVVLLTLFTINAQLQIQCRLTGTTELIERNYPRTYRSSAIHGLLRKQVETTDLPARISRTDVVANRIAEQARARLRLVQ